MTTTQVEVTKAGTESGTSLLRRFSRKVQEASIIPQVRANRYNERKTSKLAQKTSAVKRLKKRAANEVLKKMGKIKPRPTRPTRSF